MKIEPDLDDLAVLRPNHQASDVGPEYLSGDVTGRVCKHLTLAWGDANDTYGPTTHRSALSGENPLNMTMVMVKAGLRCPPDAGPQTYDARKIYVRRIIRI